MIFRHRQQPAHSQAARGFNEAVALADRHRDDGDHAEAARRYAEALALAPGRTDIKVQLANMLKDSGDLPAAERVYREALVEDSANPDIHLQLGHLLKLAGRRSAALESYRQVLKLDPQLAAARLELAAAGEPTAQMAAFHDQMRHGGPQVLIAVRAQLDRIIQQVEEIRRTLPDLEAAVAFPVEAYGSLREMFDCPPPTDPEEALSIGVVLLADREPLDGLQTQIDHLFDQSHARWTLLVVGADRDRRAVVERIAATDARVRWIEASSQEALAAQEVRAAATLRTDWALFLAPGARLHRHALAWIASTAARTGAAAIVADEERGQRDQAMHPLVPTPRDIVDPDAILEANLHGETVAVALPVVGRLEGVAGAASVLEARSRLLLLMIRGGAVAHIPLPLVHVAAPPPADADAWAEAHVAAVRAHLGATAVVDRDPEFPGGVRVRPAPTAPDARLAVIIPTRNNSADVADFVDSLLRLAHRPEAVEVLVVNNGQPISVDPTLTRLAETHPITVMEIAEPFNWARFNNLAAANGSAPYLVFANDDMRMLTRDWDLVLRGLLEREDIGAVGARLIYPDDTLQHAGMLFDWHGLVIHDGLYRPSGDPGPARRWQVTRAVSAVTGAFLATRRVEFAAVGGFDEAHLAVSYGDVDFALKQRARGRRILWTPQISLYHHESKTRGLDRLDPAKAARDAAEASVLRARWPGVLDVEPGLNPFWRQASLPHRLLAFPAVSRVWAHVERGAGADPWRVPPPRF